jgi:signal transduction histidine kinase
MSRPTRPPQPDAATTPPSAAALAALLEGEADLDALERMLLALAVHPDGGGAGRAWLLRLDARRGVLECVADALADPATPRLTAALGRARRSGPRQPADGLRLLWAVAPEALEGAAAQAWTAGAVAEEADSPMAGAPWSGPGHRVCLALRRGPRPHGMLVLAPPEGAAWAGPARARALQADADLALAAQARSAEARRRSRQLAALAELTHASIGAINVAEALHLLARLAATGTATRGSGVFRTTASGGLALAVAHGPGVLRESFAQGFRTCGVHALRHHAPLAGERGAECEGLPAGIAGETTVWAVVPIVAYGEGLGVLVVHDGLERPGLTAGFERGDLEFLAALADHAALLLHHASGVERLEAVERARREQAGRLRELESLSTLGELAARVADEARNPLASIAAFARRALRECGAEDPQRESLEVVVREAGRLEALLAEQQRWSGLERPRLRLQALNQIVQEALQAASETLVRRRVRLVKRLAPDLPELLLDAPRIRRMVDHVLAFALESAPMGGRLRLESRRTGAFVLLEVAHDGSRAAGDLADHLFVAFGAAGGAAVGLGMADQVVREHGGEVRVRAEGDWGTVFAITLPVLENSDRRHGGDRRSPRRDRRRRGPEAEAAGG